MSKMRVKITYLDSESLVKDEVVQNAKSRYGENCVVEVLPANNTPESFISFGIKQLITMNQLEYYFDLNERGYGVKKEELKSEILSLVSNLFDEIVEETEKGLE